MNAAILTVILSVLVFSKITIAKSMTRSRLRPIEINYRAKLYQTIKSSMITVFDPCEDFYEYVCGDYSFNFPRPSSKYYSGVLYNLRQKVNEQQKKLLSEEIVDPSEYSDIEIKTKNFYKSCMDNQMIMDKGAAPIMDIIENIGQYPTWSPKWSEKNFNWIDLVGNLKLYGIEVFMEESVEPFEGDKNNFIVRISHIEIDRDDYFTVPKFEVLRSLSENLRIARILRNFGVNYGASLPIAYEISKFHSKLLDILPSNTYKVVSKPLSVSKLIRDIPGIDWKLYLSIVTRNEVKPTDQVYFRNFEHYFEKLVSLINSTPKTTIANYLFWKLIENAYVENRVMDKDRSNSCLQKTIYLLDNGVSMLYHKRYFDENAQAVIMMIVVNFRESFKLNINNTIWLDDITRQRVIDKIDKTKFVIGYQDFIKDTARLDEKYKTLNIDPENYYQNVFNIGRCNTEFEHKYLKYWKKRPIEYLHTNFYPSYDPTENTVFIPPGILQYPIYHPDLPKAWLYATIGIIAARELMHGLDAYGKNFNGDGIQEKLLSNETEVYFQNHSTCFVNQYNKYHVPSRKMFNLTLNIDGTRTLTENIADNAALRNMFATYKEWLNRNQYSDILQYETIPGQNVTSEKFFFISFAQTLCEDAEPVAKAIISHKNDYSPANIRVNGAVSNSKEFAETFQCSERSPMNPRLKCVLW